MDLIPAEAAGRWHSGIDRAGGGLRFHRPEVNDVEDDPDDCDCDRELIGEPRGLTDQDKRRNEPRDDPLSSAHSPGVPGQGRLAQAEHQPEQEPQEGPREPQDSEDVAAGGGVPEIEPRVNRRGEHYVQTDPAESASVQVEGVVDGHVQVGEAEEEQTRREENDGRISIRGENQVQGCDDLQKTDEYIHRNERPAFDPPKQAQPVYEQHSTNEEEPRFGHENTSLPYSV